MENADFLFGETESFSWTIIHKYIILSKKRLF